MGSASVTSLLFWLTAALMAAVLLLGGASQGNAWQVAVLELLSLAVIGLALPRLRAQGRLADLRAPLALIAGFMLVPLLQIIPLPFDVWAGLPGRGELAAGLGQLGAAPDYLPLSLAPAETLGDFLWLSIPAAVFLGVSASSGAQRRVFVLLVLGAAVLSQGLGALQLGGMGEALRFYEISNVERPVGLFANRNHHAVFLLLALPLFAAWLQHKASSPRWLTLGLLLALTATTLSMIVVTHSRAGLGLAVLAVFGALLVLLRGRAIAGRAAALAGLGLTAIMATGGALLLNSTWLMHRLAALDTDFRSVIWAGTISLAERFSPLGSGLGSFVQVYPAIERVETLQFTYVNHAHNDYLEVWLEAGLAGAALSLALLAWCAWLAVRCWRARGEAAVLGQGASIAIALVAIHSIVDYPARTPAVAAVMALACALMAAAARRNSK